MMKNISIYQALLLEFDMVCTETGWTMPSQDEILKLTKALNELSGEQTEMVIAAAVVGYDLNRPKK